MTPTHMAFPAAGRGTQVLLVLVCVCLDWFQSEVKVTRVTRRALPNGHFSIFYEREHCPRSTKESRGQNWCVHHKILGPCGPVLLAKAKPISRLCRMPDKAPRTAVSRSSLLHNSRDWCDRQGMRNGMQTYKPSNWLFPFVQESLGSFHVSFPTESARILGPSESEKARASDLLQRAAVAEAHETSGLGRRIADDHSERPRRKPPTETRGGKAPGRSEAWRNQPGQNLRSALYEHGKLGRERERDRVPLALVANFVHHVSPK